jgi:hypothetical protein
MTSRIGIGATFITAGLLMLAQLPVGASAKTGLVLTPLPNGVNAGEPWNVGIQYIRNDALANSPRGTHPFVRIVSADTKTQLNFPVHPTGTGKMSARVVFPHAGWWRYTVHGFGSPVDQQTWDPVMIGAKAKIVADPTRDDPSSFPYGWVIAGAVLALGATLTLRLRR